MYKYIYIYIYIYPPAPRMRGPQAARFIFEFQVYVHTCNLRSQILVSSILYLRSQILVSGPQARVVSLNLASTFARLLLHAEGKNECMHALGSKNLAFSIKKSIKIIKKSINFNKKYIKIYKNTQQYRKNKKQNVKNKNKFVKMKCSGRHGSAAGGSAAGGPLHFFLQIYFYFLHFIFCFFYIVVYFFIFIFIIYIKNCIFQKKLYKIIYKKKKYIIYNYFLIAPNLVPRKKFMRASAHEFFTSLKKYNFCLYIKQGLFV